MSLVLAYVVGVAAVAVESREFLPTLLIATSILPLLFLFVLLLPTLVIGLLVGTTMGVTANVSSRVYIIGATAGILFGLAVLTGVLPLMLSHAPNDFVGIISQPFRAGIYGLTLGLIAAFLFQKFNGATN